MLGLPLMMQILLSSYLALRNLQQFLHYEDRNPAVNRCRIHLHFRDCETGDLGGSPVTCSTFHSKRVAELGFDSECDPKASSLNHGDD